MKRFFTTNGKFSIWKTIRNLIIIIILVAAAIGGYLYGNVLNAINNTNQDVNVQNIRDTNVQIAEGDPINVLVVGTDGGAERQEDDGYVSRSDTLMLINLNPETGTTKMVSIPRDTITNIDGQDEPDKINHAYAYGGIDLTIDTVQDFLQVPIDYYLVVNMDGLSEMIDAIGGIEIVSPLSFEYRGTEFHEGERREVDGVKAMNFARMRYDDPQGELGRQNRQKIVIKAIIDKALSLDAVVQYPRLINVASRYVTTNVDLNEVLSIYQQYLPALNNISSVQFETLEEIQIDEIAYYHIPLNARVKVANEFRYVSNMPSITASDLEDPLGIEESEERAKSLAVIINQYPTGLSEEDLQELNERQTSLETARETIAQPAPVENNNSTPNNNDYWEEPEYSQPTQPTQPNYPPEDSSAQPPVETQEPEVPAEPELPETSTPDYDDGENEQEGSYSEEASNSTQANEGQSSGTNDSSIS